MDVSDVVLLSEHDNNTLQDDVSAVLCDEYLEAEETPIPNESAVLRDEILEAEETPIPHEHDECLDAEEKPIPNDQSHDNDCISDVVINSFSPLCSKESNDDASGMPAPKKKARKRKGIVKENVTTTKQVHVHQRKSRAVNNHLMIMLGKWWLFSWPPLVQMP
jgi:hypothetical protein